MSDGHNDASHIGYFLPHSGKLDVSTSGKLSLDNDVQEGTKHDGGKPTIALIPSKPLLEIAKVLDYGKNKYGSHNWRKGIDYTRVLSAAQRHIMAWNDGQNVDIETNLSHLAHAACNLLFLLEYELSGMSQFDDRYKKDGK